MANRNKSTSLTIGYVFMPFDQRSAEIQREVISEFCDRNRVVLHDWVQVDARFKNVSNRRIRETLMQSLKPGDTLLVDELSRLGRSVGQIAVLVDLLQKADINLVSIREELDLRFGQDPDTAAIKGLFALFAEIERHLLSERAREGLQRAVARGKKLGRPKGTLGRSKLDGKEGEIAHYLNLGVNKTNIAKIFQVSWSTLNHFIHSRGLGV